MRNFIISPFFYSVDGPFNENPQAQLRSKRGPFSDNIKEEDYPARRVNS